MFYKGARCYFTGGEGGEEVAEDPHDDGVVVVAADQVHYHCSVADASKPRVHGLEKSLNVT